MKVAFIHTDFRIYWPARLAALNMLLQQHGMELEVVEIAGAGSPYAFAGKASSEGLVWHILFPEKKMEALTASAIKPVLFGLLSRMQPDILVAGALAFPSGALSVCWAKKYKRKVICFDDAKIDAVPRSGLVNFIKRHIYNGVYAMLYPSADWEETGKFWGFKKEQLFYGIDVVDNAFWQNYQEDGSRDKKFFLAVGRQVMKKNFLHILESYKRYYDKYGIEAIPLVLVGDGPEHQKLEQFVEEHHLTNSVTLLPFLSQMELRKIYHHAEVLLLSSNNTETWGLVINEAMACGLPVIASDQCGATHTLIKDGYNGFSFSLLKPDDLFEKMCRYHDLLPQEKEKLGKAALDTIKNWDLLCFCQGCYEAINYVDSQKMKKLSWLSSWIIDCWKGRYRPI